MRYPMFKVHIPVDETLQNLGEVLSSGFLNEGIQVREFETELAKFLNADQLILVNACTSALTMAYKLSGVEPGTSVVSTAMTCIATNTPICNLGGRIIWADIDRWSGNMDPHQIESVIDENTKAIVSVSWAGSPPDLEAIDNIAKKHGIYHIHDGAHAFGAKLNGKPISDYADFTCFSFQAIKHLTTGDGGALICRDPAKYALAKKLKWFGYDRDETKDEKGEWKGQRWSADVLEGEVGYKFNMNNLSAAIGLSQLPHMADIIMAHRRNAKTYLDMFEHSKLIAPARQVSGATSSFWVFTMLLQGPTIDRDYLMEKLNQQGIGAGLVHVPNDMYSAFASSRTDLPGTAFFAKHQISLPCGWWLRESDCEDIARSVLRLLESDEIRNAKAS